MIISCIVATTENLVIGKENKIPWYLSSDLKYFKKKTLNHHIVMGRKCYQSIGHPLPKRTNIIVTRDPFFIVSNCFTVHSIEDALSLAYEDGEEEVFICGGGMIYEQSKELWDRIYWTKVHTELEGDVFFPDIDLSEWRLTSREDHKADEKNDFDYSFLTYDKV